MKRRIVSQWVDNLKRKANYTQIDLLIHAGFTILVKIHANFGNVCHCFGLGRLSTRKKKVERLLDQFEVQERERESEWTCVDAFGIQVSEWMLVLPDARADWQSRGASAETERGLGTRLRTDRQEGGGGGSDGRWTIEYDQALLMRTRNVKVSEWNSTQTLCVPFYTKREREGERERENDYLRLQFPNPSNLPNKRAI